MHLAAPMVAALVTNMKLFMTPINEIYSCVYDTKHGHYGSTFKREETRNL